jgi:hypothetical protein
MSRRFFIRFGSQPLLVALWLSNITCAQSPNCAQQECIQPAVQETKVIIDEIKFRPNNTRFHVDYARLLNFVQQFSIVDIPGETDSKWTSECAELIREGLQEQGYQQLSLMIKPHLVREEANGKHYSIDAELKRGPQYRLGEIEFSGATVFSPTELRGLFPLRHGEIVDVSKIRQGMMSMEAFYGSKGFIDAFPDPSSAYDEKNSLVNILMKMDEGKQYHVRTLYIEGLDPNTLQLLESQLRPGQVFDQPSFRRFFVEHRAALPTNISIGDAIQVKIDGASSGVDIVVDFSAPSPYAAGPVVYSSPSD